MGAQERLTMDDDDRHCKRTMFLQTRRRRDIFLSPITFQLACSTTTEAERHHGSFDSNGIQIMIPDQGFRTRIFKTQSYIPYHLSPGLKIHRKHARQQVKVAHVRPALHGHTAPPFL